MSPRSRKRHSKKKHGTQAKKDNGRVLDRTKTDDTPIPAMNNGHIANPVTEDNTKTPKNKFLNIILNIIKQLQLGDDLSQLLSLLDNLSAISNCSSNKQNLTAQILLKLTSNLIDDYEDDDDLKALKKKLESKLLTSELRKLLVDKNVLDVSLFCGFLGRGHFGILLKGTLRLPDNSKIEVVVKEKEDVHYGERIVEEAKIMANLLEHKNILKILAFEKNGPRFAVQYMALGNLRAALHEYKFSDSKLIDVLRDVAAGMKYISNKNYLHRDLKVKNILLDSNGDCKISEFGLCQYVGDTNGVYEDKEKNKNDHLYISPETKKTCKFTTKTDVWAMGLLAWEMYYIAKRVKDEESMDLLRVFMITGRLLNCGYPLPLWTYFNELVLNKDPQKRPTFAKIKKKLDMFKNEE